VVFAFGVGIKPEKLFFESAKFDFHFLKILLLNQTFYPDVVSTAQHLTDLALALQESGHKVTVISSRRGYDDSGKEFSPREIWRGIRIYRVRSTLFGKSAKWRRALDFASFLLNCCARLFFLPKQDVVVALTSPPLISFLAACFTRLRGGKFVYWVMDLNPDEAIAAGWLNANSFAGNFLERISRFSFRSAKKIIALDHFMRERIVAKGISPEKIEVIPPWSHDEQIYFDEKGRERFRAAHGLKDKFVVMYSGNHSPCHPLDTLLNAASQLAVDEEILFCFIGGGSGFKHAQILARENSLRNVLCLPYQPIENLSASLSAADLHVVVMGDEFVGIVHPCKIYNILRIGAPILYIGPHPSHVTEILDEMKGRFPCARTNHGETMCVVEEIQKIRAGQPGIPNKVAIDFSSRFSKAEVLPGLMERIAENVAK
jgi:glycosyltransferase involved in cell wall biosynthesis